jgi:ribonuclease HII
MGMLRATIGWRSIRYPWSVINAESDMLFFERPLVNRGEVVVGLDEVGRGALAGPMVVGAVVVTSLDLPPAELTDSKLLTAARREALVDPTQQWATGFSLGWVSAREIDEWGIRLALAVAATRALDQLEARPTYALIDGSFNLLRAPVDVSFGVEPPPQLKYRNMPATTIVKGDRRSATIAAASVLAKVRRDRHMQEMHNGFEAFGWANNKGYGSSDHMDAIRRLGPSPHHRISWKLPGSNLEEAIG